MHVLCDVSWYSGGQDFDCTALTDFRTLVCDYGNDQQFAIVEGLQGLLIKRSFSTRYSDMGRIGQSSDLGLVVSRRTLSQDIVA